MHPATSLSPSNLALAKEFVRRLAEQVDPHLFTVTLFGSRARGDADEESDLSRSVMRRQRNERSISMKTYRGIVKGNTVILEQEPEVQEGTEAIVLIQTTEEDEQEIVQRQKALLKRGFAMGKLRYKKREELYERGK